jgi:lipopolysaccharide/colanic/teichoic acid biosynthesis glycosyltransferase
MLRRFLWYAAGVFFILEAGSILSWRSAFFWRPDAAVTPGFSGSLAFLAAIAASYAGALLGAKRILALPRCGRLTSVIASASFCFAVSALALFLLRAYYSRSFMILAFVLSIAWIYGGLRMFFSSDAVRYGFVPGAAISELEDEWRSNFIKISSPESGEKFDVLVVSPYLGEKLSPEWARYVTNMMIQGVPTTHPGAVYEFFTGRLPIERLTEGPGVVFHPRRWYMRAKRVMDWAALVILFIPAVVCMAVISAALLCSSGRPIFFAQERTGKNGAPFMMYKFRSMTDGEVTGAGRFLRKYRLDELPQIVNVMRGEMSFIGPRPEVPELTRKYAERIPFYPYRYATLPGITGWAQVNYGYAAVTSENRIKLGYDLYYIKHASFALDALIVLKTIKTMLRGFGGR